MTKDNENASSSPPRRRVVVGIDGSSASHEALRVALNEARQRHATLEVVHAWTTPAIAYLAPLTGGGPPSYLVDQDADVEGQAVLAAALDDVGDVSDVSVKSSLIEGHPARVLVEEARGADLLVVGRRGRGHLATILLGSTSRDCTEHAECPVLVVPPASNDLAGSAFASSDGLSVEGEDEDNRTKSAVRATPRGQMILEEIALDECLQLIGRSHFGRVALVDAEQRPLTLPVNFSSTPDGIVIRTDLGTSLEQASQRHVALQVDDVNPSTHEGWSVLVRGQAYDVTDALDDRSERLRATEVDTWAPGGKARRILIKTSLVTGRRLRLIPAPSHDAAA